MVYNSEEANFPLYISCRERVVTNRRNEYNIELPGPAIDFSCHKQNELISLNIQKRKQVRKNVKIQFQLRSSSQRHAIRRKEKHTQITNSYTKFNMGKP